MSKVTRLAVVLLSAKVLTGCPRAAGGQVLPPDGERPRVFVRADPRADEALQEVGARSQVTAEAYLAVRRAYPESTAGQEALYRAGILYFEQGDFVNARRVLSELIYENPLFERADEVRSKLSIAAGRVGAHTEAVRALVAQADAAEGPERERLLAAAAQSAQAGGLWGEALRLAIRRVDEAGEGERATALAELTSLVEGKARFGEVAEVREGISTGHPAWPLLTFKVARVYYHLRDWPRLEAVLREFLSVAPTHAFAPDAREMLARANRRSAVRPNVVGVLLPLSGKYEQLGKAVLRGVQLALKGSTLELVVKDTQGDVDATAAAAEQLVFDEGAIALIGPLLDDDSRRAALVAEELGVPILTLTKAEDITRIGAHVFRNMLTNSQQARALANYATGELGYKSFALLYPNIPFGVELANQFWDELSSRGAEVRGAESYEHDQTTYTTQAKKLVGRYYLEDRSDYLERQRELTANLSSTDAFRRRKALEKLKSSLEPVVDFEALFIPDRWQRVGLVAPALAVEDIITNACDPKDLEKIRKTTGKKDLKTVTLLGTNTWSSPKGRSGLPELVERGGKFVTCSVYVDGFFADSSRPATQRFVKAFETAYPDSQPSLLDAVGFDSAKMVRQVIEKAAPSTRDELRQGLSALKDFDGATGRTTFNERREAEKPLFFLTIDAKGVRELTPTKTGS